MRIGERGVPFGGLWAFALAFGWIEAAVVIYLHAIYAQDVNDLTSAQFRLVLLPTDLVTVEVVREACTLVLLVVVGWLASRRLAGRIGAFLLVFGVWDLIYYAGLRLVLGWPDTWTRWDLLFLIPMPWVAPVWAPATVAGAFVVAGSYLFWTDGHPRAYTWTDATILAASAVAIVGAFLVEWRTAFDRQATPRFPLWLFWAGVLVGAGWFLRAERREWSRMGTRKPQTGGRVRAMPSSSVDEGRESSRPDASDVHVPVVADGDLERLTAQYAAAARELSALRDRIRAAADRTSQLRERLILLGQHGLVHEREEFFQ